MRYLNSASQLISDDRLLTRAAPLLSRDREGADAQILLTLCLVAVLMLAWPAAAVQQADQYPAGPVLEMSGTITRVQAVRGQGMPFIEVEHDGETTRVQLGSMRYLLQHNFSPAAGEKVEIEAFRRDGNELAAKKVRLVKQNKTLTLRDDDGRPLWQRGRYGQTQGQGRGKLEAEGKQ